MIDAKLRQLFTEHFGTTAHTAYVVAQAPGRVEVAGNHTDHQGGYVMSGALNRYIYGIAATNTLDQIRVVMEGFPSFTIELPLSARPRESERGTSAALVRGMAVAFEAQEHKLRGFDLAVCADLPSGAGVSSSAAFEMLVGVVLRALHGTKGTALSEGETLDLTDADRIRLALEGMRTEQHFFGKMCGAQDQLASALGGLVLMDFATETPRVKRVSADFQRAGYALVLVNSGVDHSLYNDEYDAVPQDMFAVARRLGASRLGDVAPERFLQQRESLIKLLGEDKVLRAQHFYEETARVQRQYDLLEAEEFSTFLQEVIASGISSATKLCNVTPKSAPAHDMKAVMPRRLLDYAARLLAADGAWRIHGGGFGGSILCIVPLRQAENFVTAMEAVAGEGSCLLAHFSAEGAQACGVVETDVFTCIEWAGNSDYGQLELTINLLKPEKDPRDIARSTSSSAYCDLCRENVEYRAADELKHDARMASSEIQFDKETWRLHFSPYRYYLHHCIVMSEIHYPMAIKKQTYLRLLACVDRWPYYFMGSNADLPIVGGSILGHDHFQGGEHIFPLMKRPVIKELNFSMYPQVKAGIVDWPASVIRLTSVNARQLIDCAWNITQVWRDFFYEEGGVLPYYKEFQYSSVTPIMYRKTFVEGQPESNERPVYVLDIVLRNNRTTDERPFGLFHPAEDLHHIKKENIGLIEIMGRAILPPRILNEYAEVRTNGAQQRELTAAFQRILESTGVFKLDNTGMRGWIKFVAACGGGQIDPPVSVQQRTQTISKGAI